MRDEIIILQKERLPIKEYSAKISSHSNRKIDSELETLAQQEWKEIKSNAEKKSLMPWDGLYCRLENLEEVKRGSKKLVLSKSIRYSQIRAFQKLKVYEKYPIEYHTLHVSTIGFVKTKDNNVIFGFRENTLNNSSYTPIGGGLQPDEIEVETAEDLEKNMFKEIEEETGVSQENILTSSVIGIIHAVERMNVFIFFDVQLNLNCKEVEEQFNLAQETSEHDSLIFIKSNNLKDFLKDKPSYLQAAYDLSIGI